MKVFYTPRIDGEIKGSNMRKLEDTPYPRAMQILNSTFDADYVDRMVHGEGFCEVIYRNGVIKYVMTDND